MGRVNTMTAAFCVDCRLKLTGRYCGKCGRDYGASAAMQEPGDDDDDNEEDEEGVEEEGLASSSDDDADGIVEMVVRGKRKHTRNPRVLANSTVMVARNPAFRQKAPGIRGGVWGESPRFFLFFLFFSCKNHLIQVKDSQ